MVSVAKESAFELREHYLSKIIQSACTDPFKAALLVAFDLHLPTSKSTFDFSSLSLYQRCSISGLDVQDVCVSEEDLLRLLGQAPKIDSTPLPWVSDVLGVMALKWLVEKMENVTIECRFKKWLQGFLSQQASTNRMNIFEKDIAIYVTGGKDVIFMSACIPLFLHYTERCPIDDHHKRQSLIETFMGEFRAQVSFVPSTTLLGLFVYVFDKIDKEIALVPPSGWSLNNLEDFLRHIPVGLRRWTWESKARTRNSDPVKWLVRNEYHVQNLLYVLLAPIFIDISDEIYLQPLGQKTLRIDLYLPSMHTVIEVKYRKDTKKSFPTFIGEIAEDASLYRSDPMYKDSHILCFLWDHTRATQEHAKFKEGVMKIDGIDACIVISSPSVMC